MKGPGRYSFLLGLLDLRNSQLKTCDKKEKKLDYICGGKEVNLNTHINGLQLGMRHDMRYLGCHGDEDAGEDTSVESSQGMKAERETNSTRKILDL
jgi:hypothetical protein